MIKKGFLDLLGENLADLPEATRLVIALDPKSLISPDNPFMDAENRLWNVFVYRLNDLELRSFLQSRRIDDERLLLVAQGNKRDDRGDTVIDISYIPDLIDEATIIIDCSPPGLLEGYIKDPLPTSVFEEPVLSLWTEDIGKFVQNIRKYQKALGKGRYLDKFDSLVIALTTSCSTIDMERMATLPADQQSRLLFFIQTVLETDLNEAQLAVLKAIIQGPEPTSTMIKWCELDKTSLSRFLYFGLVSIRYAIPNGLERIQLLGLIDLDIQGLGESAPSVLKRFKNEYQIHREVACEVEKSLTHSNELSKLMKDAKFGSYEDSLGALDEEVLPAVVCSIAEKTISDLVPNAEGRTILGKWHKAEKESDAIYPETVFKQKAIDYRSLLRHFGWIESCLAAAPAASGKLLDLINIYRQSNIHLLELELAEINEIARRLNKEICREIIKNYAADLQHRIEEKIMAYDEYLANTVRDDFQGYGRFERLNTNILRNLIQAGSYIKPVVWIIILDGVRLDTWDRIIWPKLRGLFETDSDQLTYLATLPSYTDVSRVAFLAGKLPAYWKDYNNNPTSDHNILLSRYLMLGRDESKKKVKIVTRVEDKEDQEVDFDNAQFRCMIFNVCDTWIHSETGNLLRVNEIVKEKFEKIVFPELESRIGPEDLVVVTSDHGFIELKKKRGHRVEAKSKHIEDENITYRYILNEEYDRGLLVDYGLGKRWTVSIGYDWFERQNPKGKLSRYSHGGLSMAEMAVPAIRLKKRVEKRVELEMSINPLDEYVAGEVATIMVNIRNAGTEEIRVALEARIAGRLIEQESLKLPSGSPFQWKFQTEANPKAKLISIVAQYSASGREKTVVRRQISVPLKEEGAKIKIDTSALDVFDEK
jgi:hypothetical protein